MTANRCLCVLKMRWPLKFLPVTNLLMGLCTWWQCITFLTYSTHHSVRPPYFLCKTSWWENRTKPAKDQLDTLHSYTAIIWSEHVFFFLSFLSIYYQLYLVCYFSTIHAKLTQMWYWHTSTDMALTHMLHWHCDTDTHVMCYNDTRISANFTWHTTLLVC